jgi:hypothetical protein
MFVKKYLDSKNRTNPEEEGPAKQKGSLQGDCSATVCKCKINKSFF